jgi:outer membrane autotransporter protein
MKQFKRNILATAILTCSTTAAATGTAITLTGDYIKIGTNDWGTLGSFGNTSPGILYDNTGTSTFNTSYDYLTPGWPFEGFYVQATSSGSTYNTGTNNHGGMGSGLSTTSFTDTSSGTTNSVHWVGSYDNGSGKLFDITNDVSFEDSDKMIKVTTTITAAQGLSDLYFLRVTDPDAQAAPGDSSATTNVRGNGDVPTTNLVYAEALASKYVIGYYTTAAANTNTGVSGGWSEDPTDYYAGVDDGNGDNTIGIAFYNAALSTDSTWVIEYYYIFGSDIAAALEAVGGFKTLDSTVAAKNSPAYGAAKIIDANPDLLAVFTSAGLSGNNAISQAVTQTLPLLTGSSTFAITNALSGMNRVIQARIAENRGMSSGDAFLSEKHFWLKPFSSWAEQENQNGISGFDANTFGIATGFDGAVNDKTLLGLAFSYANTNIDSKSDIAPNDLKTDTYQLVGYGSYNLDETTELNFQLDFGRNSNKGQRSIAFTSTEANSNYDSYTAHIGAGISKQMKLDDKNAFIPSVRIDYTRIKDEAYTEKDAGVLNLNVDERETSELLLGVDGKFTHKLSDFTTFSVNAGAAYDFHNDKSSITSAFAGAPNATFVTYGIRPEAWQATAGMGLLHQMQNGTELSVRYDAEYKTGFLNQTASLKARWMF